MCKREPCGAGGVARRRSACPACGVLSSRLSTAPLRTGPRLWPRLHLRAGEVYRSSHGRLQRARESQSWAAGNGARLAAVLPRLGNFPRKAGRTGGRAPVDTCQGTVSVTVPGKQAARPAVPSRSRAGGGARSDTERCEPVRGDRVRLPGVQVRGAGWVRARGRDSGVRTAGTRSRTWALASSVLPGRGADRDEAPPCGQSRHRRCLGAGPSLLRSGGLGGPAALTAAVSPKTVTSFLLARLERLTLIRTRIKQAVCGMEFVFPTRSLVAYLRKCFLGKRRFTRAVSFTKGMLFWSQQVTG